MIQYVFGKVGSGKTATVVRDMCSRPKSHHIFTNIQTTGLRNVTTITKKMFIRKEKIGQKRDGTILYKERFNKEFWEEAKKKYGIIDVILDELHTLHDARKAMSKKSKIMNDFLAMIRRILNSPDGRSGTLTMITQLSRRADVVGREMANNIRHCRAHYVKECTDCGRRYNEHNEVPEPLVQCPSCGSEALVKKEFIIENWAFSSIGAYEAWILFGAKTYYKRWYIEDVENYFDKYNTLQWDDLFSDDEDDDDDE